MKKLFFYVIAVLFNFGLFHQNTTALSNSCNALDLAKNEDWKAAVQCAHAQKNPTLLKLVLWSKYADRNSGAKTEDILNFVADNPHFPDTTSLIATAETKINDNTNTALLKRWFSSHLPITDNGVKYYFYLMEHKMDKKKHEEWIKKAWTNSHHDKRESKFFLAKFKSYLSQQDHVSKINHMIAIGHTKIEPHLMNLLDKDHQALLNSRLRIMRNQGSLSTNLGRVPARLKADSGLIYSQATFYEKKGQYGKIAELLSTHSDQESTKNDGWFKIRSRTALELHQKGNHALAYQVSSTHHYSNPINYVDAELLSGKLALLKLNDPKAALKHFKNVTNKAKFPATIAKSAYWCGMTCLKLGIKTDADKYFAIAANHLGTFYGQLANVKLQKKKVGFESITPHTTEEDMNWTENNELVKVSKLVAANNHFVLTKKFTNAAYAQADTLGKKYLLTNIGSEEALPNLSVAYNKIAERDGFFSPENSYPVVSLQSISDNNEIDPALVLAVIRQESEFHSKATSPAGAMGLMQILYGTAENVSKNIGLTIDRQSLYNPAINVKIGSYYLSRLLKRYDNNYILAIAAYNAGPVPVDKWIKRYGDPRKNGNSTQASIEWIEHIPYYETRTYVQHVLSNVQLYKNILNHKEEETPLRELNIDLTHDLAKSA